MNGAIDSAILEIWRKFIFRRHHFFTFGFAFPAIQGRVSCLLPFCETIIPYSGESVSGTAGGIVQRLQGVRQEVFHLFLFQPQGSSDMVAGNR
jgi:hypothetical protein